MTATAAIVVNLLLVLRQPPPSTPPSDPAVQRTGAAERRIEPERDDAATRAAWPAVHLLARVLDGGVVDVDERIRLDPRSDSLVLRPPALADGSGRRAGVADLQLATDRGILAGPPEPLRESWRTTVPPGTTEVQLRYRLVGAEVRSRPAPPGRALLRLTPLSLDSFAGATDRTAVVELAGPAVLNLTCVRLEPRERLCALRDGSPPDDPTWRTRGLTTATAEVDVQVDLQ